MYMAMQEATSNPEVDMHVNKLPDDDSVRVEHSSKLPPEPLDMTFDDLLPNKVREPKPGDPMDLVQRQMCGGAWRTLCNICHQHVPVPQWNKCGYDAFTDARNCPVCFEVGPCYVEVERRPSCNCGDSHIDVAERWHRQKSKTFIVCAACWKTLGAAVSQLPVTPTRLNEEVEEGDISPNAVVVEDMWLSDFIDALPEID
jgi:hypothetical protein